MSGKVGPGNPPVEGRIRKGEVRNPKGRPKKRRGEKPVSAFQIVLDKALTVSRDGRERRLTAEAALQLRTYKDALAGDRAAQREVLKMIKKRDKYLASRQKPEKGPVELRSEEDPTNADEALLLLGIACRDPAFKHVDPEYERLKLEPWAVQAALSRRRGGSRLTEHEISEIRRCSRDPDTLRWPRGTMDG